MGHLFDNLGGFCNRISTAGCGGGLLPLSGSFCAPFSPHTGSRIKLFIRYPVLAAVDLCTSQKHQRGASLMFAACAHWRDCSHNYVCTLATVNNSISVIVSARWVSTGRASLFDGVASRLSVHHERAGRWTSLFCLTGMPRNCRALPTVTVTSRNGRHNGYSRRLGSRFNNERPSGFSFGKLTSTWSLVQGSRTASAAFCEL